MNTLVSKIGLGLAVTGLAGNAFAAGIHFEPKNTSFTAKGSITVTAAAVSLPCTAMLTGSTVSGNARITGATFSGVSCAALTASNLPWKMEPKSDHLFVIKHIEVSALVLGVCGPGHVQSHLSVNGRITIAGAGLPGLVPCSVSGTFTTSPHVTITGG